MKAELPSAEPRDPYRLTQMAAKMTPGSASSVRRGQGWRNAPRLSAATAGTGSHSRVHLFARSSESESAAELITATFTPTSAIHIEPPTARARAASRNTEITAVTPALAP